MEQRITERLERELDDMIDLKFAEMMQNEDESSYVSLSVGINELDEIDN
jgi:hypothetical protein